MTEQDEIRTQLIKYVCYNDYLTHNSIADFIGTNRATLEIYLYGTTKNSSIVPEAKRFLNGLGRQLADIKKALQNNSGNRIELHQKRASLLQTKNFIKS